jgi:hypothetical protein
MTQISKVVRLKVLDNITTWLEVNVAEYLHLVLIVVPVVAGLLAYIFESESFYLAGGLAVAAILINILLLWVRSRFETNNDLSPFYTLIRDDLKPPKRGRGELKIRADIALVEDETHAYLANDLMRRFKPKHTTAGEPELPIIFKSLHCGQLEQKSSPKAHSSQKQKSSQKEQYRVKQDRIQNLSKALSKAEAVAVVRTEELDKNPWVYEAVIQWACKNADIPVLFVRPKTRKNYSPNEIADKFLWISDTAKLLPWGLFTRAIERSSAWRSQARYNRAMVANIFFLSVMIIHIGYIWVKKHKQDYDASIQSTTSEYIARTQDMYDGLRIRADAETSIEAIQRLVREYETSLKGINKALETKIKYQNAFLSNYDSTLNVSYWFRYQGQPYVFVTTESESTRNSFPNDKTSLIGCGFVDVNRIAAWDEARGTSVFDFESDEPILGHGCEWMARAEKIRSIACSAFQTSVTQDPKATVGICVFSADKRSILEGAYRDFLRDETRSFYKTFEDSIEKGTIVPLSERLSREKAAK